MNRFSSIHKNILHRLQSDSQHRIAAIHILKGDLQPDSETLRAEWRNLSENTPLENIALHFTPVPARVQCMMCRETYTPTDRRIVCPNCGSLGAKILNGEELSLHHIDYAS